jgi:hypothetical protein
MQLTHNSGGLRLAAAAYTLSFAADRPFAYLDDSDGVRLAELFVLSGVVPVGGDDDTLSIGQWQVHETADEVVFTLAASSSAWPEKLIRFRCQPRRLIYEIEVAGDGWLSAVNYFGGYYSGHVRWGSGFFWSGQRFQQGFNPEPNTDEINYFPAGEGSTIDIMGVPLPGKGDWFFTPPPYCYSFQGPNAWLSLGVQAAPGDNHYTEYRYHGQRDSFYLSLALEGHTAVEGRRQLPAIVLDFGPDEYAVLAAYVVSLHAAGSLPQPRLRPQAAWWHEPIFCGWGVQCYHASVEGGRAPDFARQPLYEDFLQTLAQQSVNPGIVVLDDKWQATYGDNAVDPAKWPDLRGFIDRQHAAGRKVLLWLKAWDPEGVPPEECITNAAGLPLAVDPNNIAFEKRLRESVQRMLGADGYDADGFKIDFTARIPSGPGLRTAGNAWGLELMKRYLGQIYTEAKLVKPDALVMTHTPNPYLADVLDMIRLNDINMHKDVSQAMRHRARVAKIACPAAVIDTDQWPITNKADWRTYTALQPELGVPSLYYASYIDSTREPLDADDYALLRSAWSRYRAARDKRLTP